MFINCCFVLLLYCNCCIVAKLITLELSRDWYCCNGVSLFVYGTAVAIGPTVHPPDNTSEYKAAVEWYWQGQPKNSKKTCPSAVLSTTNTTGLLWADAVRNRWLTAWAITRPYYAT
jgi:hypothetical protein